MREAKRKMGNSSEWNIAIVLQSLIITGYISLYVYYLVKGFGVS